MCVSEGCSRPIKYGGLRLCATCYNRHLRERRAKQGLCPLCGGLPKKGYAHCQECLWKLRRRYYTAIEDGICPTCKSRKAAKGLIQCPQCREANRIRLSALHVSYRASGICVSCGRRPVATKESTSCLPCQIVMRKKALLRRQRIKAGK